MGSKTCAASKKFWTRIKGWNCYENHKSRNKRYNHKNESQTPGIAWGIAFWQPETVRPHRSKAKVETDKHIGSRLERTEYGWFWDMVVMNKLCPGQKFYLIIFMNCGISSSELFQGLGYALYLSDSEWDSGKKGQRRAQGMTQGFPEFINELRDSTVWEAAIV